MTTDHVKDFISNFPDYLSHIYFMFMRSFSYLVYTRANFYREMDKNFGINFMCRHSKTQHIT